MKRMHAYWEKRRCKANGCCDSHWISGMWCVASWWIKNWMTAAPSCGTKTSDDSNSFKYGPSDLCCGHPMPIRGIPLTPHRSSIMVIPSHGMTAYQHHSDVVLQSHATSLMRCNTTCLPGLFPCLTRTVCSISLTDGCTVTCRAFFRLYCWRVRSFRFFLASDGCCWVTVEGGSDCGAYGVDALTASEVDVTICWVTVAGESDCGGACGVGGIAEDGLALFPSSLVVSLFVIACISRLKSSIIAWTAFIVTGVSAVWVVGILLEGMCWNSIGLMKGSNVTES